MWLIRDRYADLGADVVEDALAASWFAGDADLAAVRDEPVREHDPIFLRDQYLEVALDLFGRFVLGETEPL